MDKYNFRYVYRTHIAELDLYISKYSMFLGGFDVYKLIILLESLYRQSIPLESL